MTQNPPLIFSSSAWQVFFTIKNASFLGDSIHMGFYCRLKHRDVHRLHGHRSGRIHPNNFEQKSKRPSDAPEARDWNAQLYQGFQVSAVIDFRLTKTTLVKIRRSLQLTMSGDTFHTLNEGDHARFKQKLQVQPPALFGKLIPSKIQKQPNFRSSRQLSIVEIEDEFVRDFEQSRN